MNNTDINKYFSPDVNCLMNNFFTSTHFGMMFVDKKLNIIEWNNAAEEITGYSRQEIIGKQCSLLKFSDQYCDNLCLEHCRMLKVFEQKRPIDTFIFGTCLTHKNNSKVSVMSTASPIVDENNKIIGGSEIFFDTSKLENLKKEIETSGYLNGLTQLLNRQKLQEIMDKEIKFAKRYNTPLTILFIDIDDFKRYNDAYGHQEGDNVLKTLADILQKHSRETDYVFRFGGEEFLVLLPNTDSWHASQLAEKIRKSFKHHEFKPKHTTKPIHKTISIGVAEHIRSSNVGKLIERADDAMYEAKKGGKNKVVLASLCQKIH